MRHGVAKCWVEALSMMVAMFSCNTSYVHSRDCELLKRNIRDPATHAACEECQLSACQNDTCSIFPCIDGVRVVQGCAADKDCAEFSGTLCGRHSAPDYVCSTHPDDL